MTESSYEIWYPQVIHILYVFYVSEFYIFLWMIFFALTCHTLILININVAIISMVHLSPKSSVYKNQTESSICKNTSVFWRHLVSEEILSTNFNQVNNIQCKMQIQ